MTNIKPDNNRNFRAIKIDESLKKIYSKISNKYGKLDFIIYTKWHEIVGKFFSNYSEPIKVSSVPKNKDADGNNPKEPVNIDA